MQAESDLEIQCPYCWESISIRLDGTAGSAQEFSYDCEVCCRPINVTIQLDEEGNATTNVERELA